MFNITDFKKKGRLNTKLFFPLKSLDIVINEGGRYMDNAAIIRRLNWFYSLELNQVNLYTEQRRQVDAIYLEKVLEKVVEIEQGHVENIRQQIITLGGKPTLIGEAVALFTGKTAGFITGKAGIIRMLEANIELEKKAMADYKDFLLTAGGDKDLFDLLWGNLIDEDLHTAWFLNKAEELKQ